MRGGRTRPGPSDSVRPSEHGEDDCSVDQGRHTARRVAPESTTAEVYDAWAPSYDTCANRTRDAAQHRMRRLGSGFSGLDVLEFGCGTGTNTDAFARVARSVLGLDISTGMLAVAEARGLGPHVRLRSIEPGGRWPAEERSMDVVTASLVLEHIRDLSGFFSEAARVLRPGGWVWTCELHPDRQLRGGRACFRDDQGRIRSPECFVHRHADFEEAARSNGLRVCDVDEVADGELPRVLTIGFHLPAEGSE